MSLNLFAFTESPCSKNHWSPIAVKSPFGSSALAKKLNVRTVAVYSEADANSMHVQLADEAICIGKAPAVDSYLRIDRIISAAEVTDVDAIHPGYGFLSENAHFAEGLRDCNIRFIGPSPRAMQALADKAVTGRWPRKPAWPSRPARKASLKKSRTPWPSPNRSVIR